MENVLKKPFVFLKHLLMWVAARVSVPVFYFQFKAKHERTSRRDETRVVRARSRRLETRKLEKKFRKKWMLKFVAIDLNKKLT